MFYILVISQKIFITYAELFCGQYLFLDSVMYLDKRSSLFPPYCYKIISV